MWQIPFILCGSKYFTAYLKFTKEIEATGNEYMFVKFLESCLPKKQKSERKQLSRKRFQEGKISDSFADDKTAIDIESDVANGIRTCTCYCAAQQ